MSGLTVIADGRQHHSWLDLVASHGESYPILPKIYGVVSGYSMEFLQPPGGQGSTSSFWCGIH